MITIQELAEAESRRLALQTEAAINLAIGMVITEHGKSTYTVYPAALKAFAALYRVEQTVNTDGSYTITVVPRS